MSFQAGVLYFDGREIGVAEANAVRGCVLTDDDFPAAVWREPGLFLAHFGGRPYPTQTAAITFDGRLDNPRDLERRLPDLPPEADGAALALAAYEKWGTGGLADLIGDWSLVIWDRRRQQLVLASDYAGVRPLYYCVKGHRVMWSTRLLPLVHLAQAHELDDTYIAGLLAFTGAPNRTPYRGVYSVPPGCAMVLSAETARPVRFWQLPVADSVRYRQEAEYEEQLRTLFREAVQCRIPAGSRCLSELSGGLDSSSVVAMAADLIRSGKANPEVFTTLTVEHDGSRDTPFYTAMEQFCGFESLHVPAADYPFLTETDTGAAAPAFWAPLQKHTAGLARAIGATTYVTGKLGDDVMGNWWDDSEQVAGLLRDGRLGAAAAETFAWSKALRIPAAWILWRAVRASLPVSLGAAAHNRWTGTPDTAREHEDSITPALRARTGISEPDHMFSRHWTEARPERRRHCRTLTQVFELRKLQAPEALEHLDVVHPFAHRPLVAFMLGIPAALVCRPGEPRRLMRRAFQDLWPAPLRRRRSKDGFGGVFLDSLRPLADQMLKGSAPLQVVERGYVDAASLHRRLDRLSLSLSCNETQLRQIILLEFWLRGAERRAASESVHRAQAEASLLMPAGTRTSPRT